jgi:hypothetical protein
VNTRELASHLGKQPQTLHAAICRNGSYYGIRPEKLPDGSLLWPENSVERLIEYAKNKGAIDRTKKALEVLSQRRAAAKATNASAGG